jgi:hypothetical protein
MHFLVLCATFMRMHCIPFMGAQSQLQLAKWELGVLLWSWETTSHCLFVWHSCVSCIIHMCDMKAFVSNPTVSSSEMFTSEHSLRTSAHIFPATMQMQPDLDYETNLCATENARKVDIDSRRLVYYYR